MSHHPRPRASLIRPALAFCALTALTLGACGDDDPEAAGPDDTPAAAEPAGGAAADPTGEGQEFCDAYLAVSSDQGPDVDWGTASEAEIGEAMAAYATDFEPKLDALVAAAPAEATEAVSTYTGTYREILETGDDSAFDDEYLAAEMVVVDAAITSCAVDVVEATAIDYAYQGLPSTVSAGRVGFRLTNEGADVHEAVILRRTDGDTTAAPELLAMTEEEQAERAEFVGVAFVAPDSDGAVLLDLAPGEYIVACNLPVGMTEIDAEVDGAPHHTEGMVGEFTVA